MFNFHKLISKSYLFDINRVLLTRSDKLFAILGLAMAVLAIAFKLASMYAPNPVDKVLRNKFFRMFLTIGVLEVVWFGARYQNIMFFGSHFVALLILFIGILWFVKLAISVIRHYGSEKEIWEKEQIKAKYLPQ